MAYRELPINTIITNNLLERDFIKQELTSLPIKIEKEQYQSKYNSYVVYDYEPFCSDGMNIIMHIKGEEVFIKYLEKVLEEKRNSTEYLNKCLEVLCP